MPLIRRLHGNTTHCGKNSITTPISDKKTETKEDKIMNIDIPKEMSGDVLIND